MLCLLLCQLITTQELIAESHIYHQRCSITFPLIAIHEIKSLNICKLFATDSSQLELSGEWASRLFVSRRISRAAGAHTDVASLRRSSVSVSVSVSVSASVSVSVSVSVVTAARVGSRCRPRRLLSAEDAESGALAECRAPQQQWRVTGQVTRPQTVSYSPAVRQTVSRHN